MKQAAFITLVIFFFGCKDENRHEPEVRKNDTTNIVSPRIEKNEIGLTILLLQIKP